MANLLTLKVLDGYTRPVISIGDDVTRLIDTGADTPVWTQGAEILEDDLRRSWLAAKSLYFPVLGRKQK